MGHCYGYAGNNPINSVDKSGKFGTFLEVMSAVLFIGLLVFSGIDNMYSGGSFWGGVGKAIVTIALLVLITAGLASIPPPYGPIMALTFIAGITILACYGLGKSMVTHYREGDKYRASTELVLLTCILGLVALGIAKGISGQVDAYLVAKECEYGKTGKSIISDSVIRPRRMTYNDVRRDPRTITRKPTTIVEPERVLRTNEGEIPSDGDYLYVILEDGTVVLHPDTGRVYHPDLAGNEPVKNAGECVVRGGRIVDAKETPNMTSGHYMPGSAENDPYVSNLRMSERDAANTRAVEGTSAFQKAGITAKIKPITVRGG